MELTPNQERVIYIKVVSACIKDLLAKGLCKSDIAASLLCTSMGMCINERGLEATVLLIKDLYHNISGEAQMEGSNLVN